MQKKNKVKQNGTTVIIPPDKRKSKKSTAAPRKGSVAVQLYTDDKFHIAVRQVDVVGKQILGSRKSQQDMFAVSGNVVSLATEQSRAWAVVCDGMGGMASGEVASRTATDVVSQILQSALQEDSVFDLLYQAIAIANETVKQIPTKNNELTGTTLVCSVINNDVLYYASVGDSRIYVCRENELLQITRDHNYMLELQEMVDRGEMLYEEALADPQKDALISYIGIEELKIIDINQKAIRLQDNDIVLLCSDGLTKILNDDEILAIIKDNRDNVEAIVDSLLLEVQIGQPRNLDNTTIAVMKYKNN
ncbi:MAG: serine/threonine-protein phosphatase [Oscillospiraceae bacterium]|nr:serine/threonine-protein phosphatase [Oscillospiraceae bacterium]